jgi:8-oxo-dGTP pyrophosphatase MutT (NUDIX family)
VRAGGAQVIPRPAIWQPGAPAPWAGVDLPDPLPTGTVIASIQARGPALPAPGFPNGRRSAVLIALFDGEHGAEVVLTRRAWHLSSHRGEVSFPGGRLDPGETDVEAALREAHEEVLLDPATVDVVGELDHLATVVSRSLIAPVVGRLGDRPTLRAGTTEVDRILTVPLLDLMRPDTYREERWGTPPYDRPVVFFELDDETIWGATGRMLVQLLCIAAGVPGPHT